MIFLLLLLSFFKEKVKILVFALVTFFFLYPCFQTISTILFSHDHHRFKEVIPTNREERKFIRWIKYDEVPTYNPPPDVTEDEIKVKLTAKHGKMWYRTRCFDISRFITTRIRRLGNGGK